MLTIKNLQECGVKTEEGLARCLNNEGFYLKMVNMALADANFGKLREAVERGDLKAGFEAAHALKGVLGNLSLTPVYNPVSEMTELLRAGEEADYEPLLKAMEEAKGAIQALAD